MKALEMGAIETLVVWENLDINRYILKNSSTGEITIKQTPMNLSVLRYIFSIVIPYYLCLITHPPRCFRSEDHGLISLIQKIKRTCRYYLHQLFIS